jgi:hypothetical protein
MNTTRIQTDWIPRIGRGKNHAMASCHGDVQAVPVPGKLYLSYTYLYYVIYIYLWVINHLLSGMYIQVGTQNPQAS